MNRQFLIFSPAQKDRLLSIFLIAQDFNEHYDQKRLEFQHL